jgi:G6PDH family F420-dependent oxidoreductase
MVQLGINLASEAHGPRELMDNAVRAEEAGFDFAVISDHYHPWTSTQGNSPFVWSTIGGIAAKTDELELGTAVTCPILRYHPAIIAQAAATAQVMLEGRFFFGVGTGERLNEHVLGDRFPPHEVRLDMLEEALEVIRTLWTGEMTTHHGDHYTVENAQLFTLPEELPPIVVSGLGPKTATAAGRIGDGFIATEASRDLVSRYEEHGDGPEYGGTRVCYAESDEEAVDIAYEWWPNTGLKGVGQSLAVPPQFEQATQMVGREDVEKAVVTGPDPEPYIEKIQQFAAAGFDRVYLHQTGTNQQEFVEFADRELLPEFA